MRVFRYVWMISLAYLWIIWTISAIKELITRYKTQSKEHNFLDAFLYVFEWGECFAGWFIANTLAIIVCSFIVWLMSITK